MPNALIIDPEDNVAVVMEPVAKGSHVRCRRGDGELSLTALDDIVVYHKIALRDIPRGTSVLKYGERIGEAVRDIPAGSHVHVHNLSNIREDIQEGIA